MAIAAGFMAQFSLFSDGSTDPSSTSITIDLKHAPYVYLEGQMQNDFTLRGLLGRFAATPILSATPSLVVPVSVDDSIANLPTATVSGDNVTFTFAEALSRGLHQLVCGVLF